jgi:ribosome maturation factor RimP
LNNMNITESEIRSYIKDICQAENVYLLNVDIMGGGRSRQVRVTVDTDDGIKLDQCRHLSKEIGDLFYRKDIYEDGYNLEVSSPGIDKPLEHDFEYKRNIGRNLTVVYLDGDETKKVTGELKEFSGTDLHLLVGKDKKNILLSQVQQAKVKLKW